LLSLKELEATVFRVIIDHSSNGRGATLDTPTVEGLGIDSLTFIVVIADLEKELGVEVDLSNLGADNAGSPKILAHTLWSMIRPTEGPLDG
jgi:acyl carrier protein